MKILLTGFNSFAGVRVNPSERVVRAIAERMESGMRPRGNGLEIVTEILPTEYDAGTRKLRRLLRVIRPDAVICLGVAQSRKTIGLERIALNLDDEATPDNAEVIRRGRKIAPGGPDLYWSTLPLDVLQKELKRLHIKAMISNYAGAFLCNHAFYIARHQTARIRPPIPCGFIHLPGMRGNPSTRARALSQMIRAVECCLRVIGRHTRNRRRG